MGEFVPSQLAQNAAARVAAAEGARKADDEDADHAHYLARLRAEAGADEVCLARLRQEVEEMKVEAATAAYVLGSSEALDVDDDSCVDGGDAVSGLSDWCSEVDAALGESNGQFQG